MISLEEYQILLRTKERLRRQKDQAQGAYDQVLARLKEETECTTKEEAEKLLAKLNKKIAAKLPAFQKSKEEFMEKWASTLQE